ncbi:MAG: hypothetical protein AB8G15_03115 [Saprospiraceae bacterium]
MRNALFSLLKTKWQNLKPPTSTTIDGDFDDITDFDHQPYIAWIEYEGK